MVRDAKLTGIDGDTKIEKIRFFDSENKDHSKIYSEEGITESFIRPDMVIVENGFTTPKGDLSSLIEHRERGDRMRVKFSREQVPKISKNCMPQHYVKFNPSLYCAGSCCETQSLFQKACYRTDNVKHAVQMGFIAAMNMVDKHLSFYDLPMTHLDIGGTKIYYHGERGMPFTEIVMSQGYEEGKFVAWYLYGDKIVGCVTVGFQNLHLYLQEAFANDILPSAAELRATRGDYKPTVRKVLKVANFLHGERETGYHTTSL